MKYSIYLFAILQFCALLSCNNESILEESSDEHSFGIEAESITSEYCYGCLPLITAYHDDYFNEFVISWSGYNEDPKDHPITISYEVDGIYGEYNIGEKNNNGEIIVKVASNTYIAKWTVKCNNPKCTACTISESMKKEASSEIEIGSVTDCHKEYLNYSIEEVSDFSNAYDLVLDDPYENRFNTEKYMTIDRIKGYEFNSYTGSEQEMLYGVSLDLSLAPHRLRVYLDHQDMNKIFKIRFYSSRCEHNQEHYLYTSYYFDGSGAHLSNPLYLKQH